MKKYLMTGVVLLAGLQAIAAESTGSIRIQGAAAYELYQAVGEQGQNIKCWGIEIEGTEWIWQCDILVDSKASCQAQRGHYLDFKLGEYRK